MNSTVLTNPSPFEAAAADAAPEKRYAAPDPEQIREAAEQAGAFSSLLNEIVANPEKFLESDKGKELKSLAGTIWEQVGDRLKELQIDAEKLARENPGSALLAALGVGFAMGALLKR